MNTAAAQVRLGHYREVIARTGEERANAERITAEEAAQLAEVTRAYTPLASTPEERLLAQRFPTQWTAYLNGVSLGTVTQSFGTRTGLPLAIGSSGEFM